VSKRVRVTLEFMSDDAGAYPSDDEGVLNQNLFSHLNRALITDVMMKLMEAKSNKALSTPALVAYIRSYEEDIRIGKRMVDSMKVEVVGSEVRESIPCKFRCGNTRATAWFEADTCVPCMVLEFGVTPRQDLIHAHFELVRKLS